MARAEPLFHEPPLSEAERHLAAHNAYVAERVALGYCPASGMTLKRCRLTDICDCFGWPGEPT
jgi:hypothetical protein